MEGLDRSAEHRRVAADLVQGNKTVVAVEGGVLDAFGHDRSRELLELLGELHAQVAAGLTQSQLPDELDQLGVEIGPPARAAARAAPT